MAGRTRDLDTAEVSPRLSVPPPVASDRELLERFTRSQDEAAFAALVQRHGPMVLGVCRRVLGHAQEAEDAFQATFVILVQKAATIDRPELLWHWLYGVAVRTAHKARARAARRAHHERQAAAMASPESPPEAEWQDLRSLLDQELAQLPAKFRAPLVLCYLEGLTNEEAARRLGWPAGSISYRLARGRELLRQRLNRQRAFSPALFAVLLQQAGSMTLPPVLADQTVQTALLLARGSTLEIAASPAVRGLVEEVLCSGTARRAGSFVLIVLTVILSLLAAGASTAAATGNLSWVLGEGYDQPSSGGSCH